MRARYWLLYVGTLIVVGALYYADPDSRGLTTRLLMLQIATGIVAVLCAHWARKGLHDYPAADMSDLFKVAKQSPMGAGLALIALSIVFSALLGMFGRAAHAQVPPQAMQYLPILAAEIDNHWPDIPMREYPAGLIEHESGCPSMPRKCWSPTSQLKTQREEGAGLGQITRTWRPDGSQRFDSLADMRNQHPALRELNWQTIYKRPDLQLRALILMSRTNWHGLRGVTDPMQRLAMTDLAYNAGPGRATQDRRACQLTPGCNPQIWWGHVERTCTASRAPIYGKRSACDISRHHVADVMRVRAPKYRGLL